MTSVFFLFLLHLGLGLLAMMPFVPERAGTKFFKFCSAAAAFLSACTARPPRPAGRGTRP